MCHQDLLLTNGVVAVERHVTQDGTAYRRRKPVRFTTASRVSTSLQAATVPIITATKHFGERLTFALRATWLFEQTAGLFLLRFVWPEPDGQGSGNDSGEYNPNDDHKGDRTRPAIAQVPHLHARTERVLKSVDFLTVFSSDVEGKSAISPDSTEGNCDLRRALLPGLVTQPVTQCRS